MDKLFSLGCLGDEALTVLDKSTHQRIARGTFIEIKFYSLTNKYVIDTDVMSEACPLCG